MEAVVEIPQPDEVLHREQAAVGAPVPCLDAAAHSLATDSDYQQVEAWRGDIACRASGAGHVYRRDIQTLSVRLYLQLSLLLKPSYRTHFSNSAQCQPCSCTAHHHPITHAAVYTANTASSSVQVACLVDCSNAGAGEGFSINIIVLGELCSAQDLVVVMVALLVIPLSLSRGHVSTDEAQARVVHAHAHGHSPCRLQVWHFMVRVQRWQPHCPGVGRSPSESTKAFITMRMLGKHLLCKDSLELDRPAESSSGPKHALPC